MPTGAFAWPAGLVFGAGEEHGNTFTASRQSAVEILGQFAQGKDPAKERKTARADTLGAFLESHYRPWAEANQRRRTDTVGRVSSCFPDLLDKKLSDITPWLLEKYRQDRQKQGISPNTVNRDVAALKAVLGKAEKWGTVAANPLKGLGMAKLDRVGVVRFLAPDEESRLWTALEAAPDYLQTMVTVSLHTGIRRGELFALEWRDIDLDRRVLTVRGETSKTHQTRHIPLNETAWTALAGWKQKAAEAGLVFCSKGGKSFTNARKSFASLLASADIESFRWHDMRHHFASKLVMAGVDLSTVQDLMGHHDPKITRIYAHLSPEHKAAAVDKLVT
jgi:integrase